MTECVRRVVKLGGSLLDWPELMPRLRAWLASQPPAETLLVVGGGKLVDAIREADRLHHLGDEAAHWLAIRAMSINAEMMLGIPLPLGDGGERSEPGEGSESDEEGSRENVAFMSKRRAPLTPPLSQSGRGHALCTSVVHLREAPPVPRLLIVDPWPILRHEDRALMGDGALPASWDVTSDSIAARIAVLSGASQLVLLKSSLPPVDTITAASAAGYVDRYFLQASESIHRIDCVALRDGWLTTTRLKLADEP